MERDALTMGYDEGVCAICHAAPAEVLGLVCGACKDAIDADEPWTHVHEEVLFRLREAEGEEEEIALAEG
jgi:hypothetical protein